MHKRGFAILLLATIGVMVVVATSISPRQDIASHKQGTVRDMSLWPLTDHDTPIPTDPEKRAKRVVRGRKYDNSEWPINPLALGDSTVRVDALDPNLPALPLTQSNAVLIGVVSEAQAYMSNDKSGIYSEFGFRIAEVLKNTSDLPLASESLVDLQREGGRVRFSSNRVHWYAVGGAGMPQVGHRYLLFLSEQKDTRVFSIITGYELSDGRVQAIDDLPKAQAYNDSDQNSFLKEVRTALAQR
jgi:hypothetical protein